MITNILDTTPAESFALLSPRMIVVLLLSGINGAGRLVD
jgi:lipid A ethanolaminephosphotransferase